MLLVSLGNAKEPCKVVNGYNLCEDAKIIANNTLKDIGIQLRGIEYVLKSVHPEHMTVVSYYESIYTEIEVKKKISKNSLNANLSTQVQIKLIKDRSTNLLCNVYKNDPFVKDGGSFKINYSFKGGKVFHTVLIGKDRCGEA